MYLCSNTCYFIKVHRASLFSTVFDAKKIVSFIKRRESTQSYERRKREEHMSIIAYGTHGTKYDTILEVMGSALIVHP